MKLNISILMWRDGLLILVVLVLISSCGTTRYVPSGEYLLRKYHIEVQPEKEVSPTSLQHYLRQAPNASVFFGWKPLLGIYNLSPRSESAWSRLLKNIGDAPVVLDKGLLNSSMDNIQRRLTFMGYYHSQISDSLVYCKKKADVILNIALGKQYRIRSVEYILTDSLMRAFCLPDTVNSFIQRGGILSEALLEKESERITAHLRNQGYYNFNKTHISFLADTLSHDGTAGLRVYFKEGGVDELEQLAAPQQRFKIASIKVFANWNPEKARKDAFYLSKMDSVDYKGIKIFYDEKPNLRPRVISRLNHLQAGDYYNEATVNNSYSRLTSLRFLSGITMQFDVAQPHKPASADSLSAPFSFHDGALETRIQLTPSKMQGYKINMEASSNASGLIGLSPAISYFHKNIFRGGEWLNLGLMGNFQFKLNDPVRSTEAGGAASISFPTLLFPVPQRWFSSYSPVTEVGMSYSYQQRPEFTRNIVSANFGYQWRARGRFYFRLNPIQLNIVSLYAVDSTFYKGLNDPFLINSYQDHFDLGAAFTLYYTTNSAPMPRQTYFYTRWTTELSGNSLSLFNRSMKQGSMGSRLLMGISYSQYLRSEFTAVYTWRPAPAHSLAMRWYAGIGVAYGNSDALPFEKLFYAGGASSLRAWQARNVGPGSMPQETTFSIPNQTGDFKLEANIEYRPKLFWKMEGALFVDAGNIWTLRQEEKREAGAFRFNNFYKSIAVAGGLGLRLNLDFVLLRLDLGFILRDPYKQRWHAGSEWLQKDNYTLQFGVGYPF
jgi:Outer membrane protein/protective antigen OMA87